jgi:hypothetical protein
MLGREQSGKTILMASMWRELHIAGKSGVSVAAEHREDEIELGKLCRQIEDPEEPLPAPTPLGAARDWKFTVRVQGKGGGVVDAFRIRYIDYPGELIKDVTRERELDRVPRQLLDALDNSDIITGILDGHRVARLMRCEPGGALDDDFLTTLRELSTVLNEKRAGKALHIVITKWDLIASQFKLEDVITRLKKERPFRNLLEAPRDGGARVIPVSALGLNGFVQESRSLEADGRPSEMMERTSVRNWKPAYVAAPLACAIPDALDTDVTRLLHEGKARTRKFTIGRDISQFSFWVLMSVGLVTAPVPTAAVLPTEVMLKVSLENVLDNVYQVIGRDRKQGPLKRLDRTSALVRVLTFLRDEITYLEDKEPGARLMTDPETAR